MSPPSMHFTPSSCPMRALSATFLIVVAILQSHAQPACVARIALDRRNVYIQQPFTVSITLLTATWFTAPPEFGDLVIPNATVIALDNNTTGMFPVGDNQYAGIQYHYLVFPYQAGTFSIPPLEIIATTPPKGDFKGRRIAVKTSPQRFTVKPLGEDIAMDRLFVAKNAVVTEHWNRSLKNLKVGDMVKRTVTVRARGTLSRFIPPLTFDAPTFASIYPTDPELTDDMTDFDATGKLSQSVTYLLEKEGKVTIPRVAISWWNPLSKKLYTRYAEGRSINVGVADNLGMVATIKDSLSHNQPGLQASATTRFDGLIWGIPWYWFGAIVILCVIVLYLFSKTVRTVVRRLRTYRQRYLQSEAYWFKKFRHDPNDAASLYAHLYRWWDRFPHRHEQTSPITQMKDIDESLVKNWKQLNKTLYAGDTAANFSANEFKQQVTLFRERLKQDDPVNEDNAISKEQTGWKISG